MKEENKEDGGAGNGQGEIELLSEGGVTTPLGFQAAGVASGIKRRGKDLALVVSVVPAQVAAFFTSNQVKAAPVRVSMRHAQKGIARAVVVNSGNANACTGIEGLRDAQEMTRLTAKLLRCQTREVLVCSTGRIGVRLPMDKVREGIRKAYRSLSPSGGHEAAKAILTTDTRTKEMAVCLRIREGEARIGGMAKGAGMIHPKLATMLCLVTTDLAIEPSVLRECAWAAVAESFNRILVDGDTSTNDTVIVLANGLAKNEPIGLGSSGLAVFQQALRKVMRALAKKIVADGEGTTKVIEVSVRGARTLREAELAARTVARSLLVKCAWHGADPAWGRIMDALGYSGARVREELVEIFYNGIQTVRQGERSQVPESHLRKVLRQREFTITIDLHLGSAGYSVLTTDLTEGYVRINSGE